MDFNGEKEFKGAMSLICWRMVARLAGWKIFKSSRRVIRRVLEGGAGCERGGSEERSRERGERERFVESGVERGEEVVEVGGEVAERFRASVWIGERGWRGSVSAMIACRVCRFCNFEVSV
jgi:hypothetical protein